MKCADKKLGTVIEGKFNNIIKATGNMTVPVVFFLPKTPQNKAFRAISIAKILKNSMVLLSV